MRPLETEEPEAPRQRRRRLAGILVTLLFGIPVVYGLIMGIVSIVRYILADLR